MPSRRRVLATASAGLAGALAGCAKSLGSPTPDDPPPAGTDADPDPENHVFGATGDWSSFGCNAANNRRVGDGQAPVDGLTERWRVPVGGLNHSEPVVVDGRVFLRRGGDRLVAYDADDGTKLWEATAGSDPLVRDDTVYVGRVSHLAALDVADGSERWRVAIDSPGHVGTPATRGGDWLAVPADEYLYRVDVDDQAVAWSRRLFGRLVGPAAFYQATLVVVATEAGKLYALDAEGTGWGEWNLPAQPQAPPTTDTDGVYINCLDGNVHGAVLENAPRLDLDWAVETGWANGGLAVNEHLYAGGTRGLTAIDPESGERLWTHDTGDWRHTAPALARDTLFVGGDALYAVDPTPSGGEGPAPRFERSFHGPVNAPALDDGSLYVVAETGKDEHHLLAFE